MTEAGKSLNRYGSRAKPIQIGERFGRWTVISEATPGKTKSGYRQRRLLCRCECGTVKSLLPGGLRYGSTRSCGCLQRDVVRARSITHGHTTDYRAHPLYGAWLKMRARCRNSQSVGYEFYGARGITICDRWFDSFQAFLDDMGPRPTKAHTVDRIDNNAGYCPENCRWADKKTQARNTRRNRVLWVRGKPIILAELAERSGLDQTLIRWRISQGWDMDTIDQPPMSSKDAARKALETRWGRRTV